MPTAEQAGGSSRTPSVMAARRSSFPPLSISNIYGLSGLRSALLGYLGEAEAALRSRLSAVPEQSGGGQLVSDSDFLSASQGYDDDIHGTARALPATLRYRGPPNQADSAAGESSFLLRQLSALREDVLAYMPSKLSMPTPTLPSREWLRSLPYELSAVDSIISLSTLGAQHRWSASDPVGVQSARQRVIELVHTLVPSEDWGGWERLGWEESPPVMYGKRGKLGRSVSASGAMRSEGEETEDEPEYLFPNRTPASLHSLARRRAVRSKSLGSASIPRLPTHLRRMSSDDSNGSLVVDEPAEEEILEKPEWTDTKLTKAVAPSKHLGPTAAEAVQRAHHGTKLIDYEDLPFPWRNNEHIISGYRFIPLNSNAGPIPLIKSAFSWHNETLNIHSHFIPTILILLAIPIIIFASPLSDPHPLDTAQLVVYLLAAVSCLISSAGWHVLCGCASLTWFEWGACVDYIGISWLIAASFGTVAYNGFYCHPRTVLIYSSTNILCGALGSYLPFQAWFNKRQNKKWRISFFLFLCLAMIAPVAQMFYQHGYDRASSFVSPFTLSGWTYVVGLLFYAFHFPECVVPGKFDYWFHSHQIWHASIVLAIILHYRAAFVAHSTRFEYSCAMPDAGTPVSELAEYWVREVIGALRRAAGV